MLRRVALYFIIIIGSANLLFQSFLQFRTGNLFWDLHVYTAAANVARAGGNVYVGLNRLQFVYPPLVLKAFAALGSALPGVFLCFYVFVLFALALPVMRGLLIGLILFSGMSFSIHSRFVIALATGNITLYMHMAVVLAWLVGVQTGRRGPFWSAVFICALLKPYFLAYILVPFVVFGLQGTTVISAVAVVLGTAATWGMQWLAWPRIFADFLHALHRQVLSGTTAGSLGDVGHGLYYFFAEIVGSRSIGAGIQLIVSIGLVVVSLALSKQWRRRGLSASEISLAALALAVLINPRLKVYDDSLYCGLLTMFVFVSVPEDLLPLRDLLAGLAAFTLFAIVALAERLAHASWAHDVEIAISLYAPLLVLAVLELVAFTTGRFGPGRSEP